MKTKTLAIFQHHFARLWPRRNEAPVRAALRDNIRGQRAARRRETA